MCRFLVAFSCLVLLVLPADAATWYVDASNTGTEDGTAWSTAYTDLKDALTSSSSGDEIWVAAGEYNPGSTPYQMKEGVDIYGGFDGSETSRDDRDWEVNVTTLTAADGVAGDITDNYGNIIKGANSAILDGFLVTRAKGTAMINFEVSPTVNNCHFFQHGSYGMKNNGSSSDPNDTNVSDCLFEEIGRESLVPASPVDPSFSPGGGGMANDGLGTPIITGCTFLNNEGNYCSGALYADGGSSAQVTGCIFIGNTAGIGGAVNVNTNYTGHPVFEDCVFEDNIATNTRPNQQGQGGGFWLCPDGTATLRNCVFKGNSAVSMGGAVWASASNLTVEGCEFESNYSEGLLGGATIPNGPGGAIYFRTSQNGYSDGEYVIEDCTFSGNAALLGGAICADSNATISNCTFAGNVAYLGAAFYLDETVSYSTNLVNCTFAGNDFENPLIPSTDAGVIYNLDGTDLSLEDCIVTDNSSTGLTTVINGSSATTTITSCSIEGSGGSSSWDTDYGTDGGGNVDATITFVSLPDDGGDGWWDDPSTGTDESANNDYGDLHLLGDINGDGFVGQLDQDVITLNWGQTVTPGDVASGDLDGDGFVGTLDQAIVLLYWGQGITP